ncbi:MAG: 23S rRNA (adenine(2030)-N(6))-methyltransferase RlmJ [Methylocystis sp.]
MNYRHGFHAGNFADVLKHALLARLLSHFLRKNARFRVLDTHAGEGAYDLRGDESERTGEWRGGVGRLADLSGAPAEMLELLAPYIDALGPFVDGRPRIYPGSPLLAQGFLGEQGKAIFCELRADAFAALRRRFARDKRIKTINLDGYTAASAFLPPVERRGLVLIDPPFEQPNEFRAMFGAFGDAYHKWPTGVYVLWHPVKDVARTAGFLESFREAGIRRVLRIELCVGGTSERLSRAGLVVINPPFGFEQEARALLPFLTERLAQGQGAGFVVEAVTGE